MTPVGSRNVGASRRAPGPSLAGHRSCRKSLSSRLTLAARMSQRRATELARHSAALTEAMDRQEELRQELAYRAMHDPLTGLSNRVVLAERLEWPLTRNGGATAPRCCCSTSTDSRTSTTRMATRSATRCCPKSRNGCRPACRTTLSWPVSVATSLRSSSTRSARPEAWRQAEAGLGAIQQPVQVDDQEVYLSANIGLLVVDPTEPPIAPSEALCDADLALHAAANLGKNPVATFEPRLRSERQERVRVSAGLQRALCHGELRLNYQPIIHLLTGDILAVLQQMAEGSRCHAGSPRICHCLVARATGRTSVVSSASASPRRRRGPPRHRYPWWS